MLKSDLPFRILLGGTVTFLFTDIEGSTQLLDNLGDQYSHLLEKHREILRNVFAARNGHEVDSRGEEFFIAFPRATDALAAAVKAQQELAAYRWPEGVKVRVRMGLHTGEPWLGEEGYVGMDVHRAARIGNLGHGGQILLSETTTSLVRDELPPGVDLLEMGRHKLRGVRRPERIHQLVIDGLCNEFPALKSIDRVPESLKQWRANRSSIKKQIALAGTGGALIVGIISVISVAQLQLMMPEEFAEAMEVVSWPVWLVTNVIVGSVWGGFQGIASGLLIGIADTFWIDGSWRRMRILLGSIAGLAYTSIIIFTASSSGTWTSLGPEIFVPVYLIYGLILGAAFTLVFPPLGSTSSLRRQLVRSSWASIIIGIAGIVAVSLAYWGDTGNIYYRLDAFMFIVTAILFPLGIALSLIRPNESVI
ncbi:MAG: hypothetical protein GTO18_17110 [Anaerolineales bacterium]|nr:hypothetical protein [Anaerolineales bacterium]